MLQYKVKSGIINAKGGDTMKAKKKKRLFITGLIAMLTGISVLGVFGWKRISREIEK